MECWLHCATIYLSYFPIRSTTPGIAPLSLNQPQEDTNSLVRVQTGGEFFFDCHARYTASGMSAVVTPYPENPSWMRLHVLSRLRTRRQLEQQHHEQQHQEQQGEQQQGRRGAGTTPPSTTAREFSSLFFPSAQHTFEDRQILSPSYITVNDNFPYRRCLQA